MAVIGTDHAHRCCWCTECGWLFEWPRHTRDAESILGFSDALEAKHRCAVAQPPKPKPTAKPVDAKPAADRWRELFKPYKEELDGRDS